MMGKKEDTISLESAVTVHAGVADAAPPESAPVENAPAGNGAAPNGAAENAAPAETSGAGQMFQQMVENLPINVMVCDLTDFRITYANPATLKAVKELEHVLDIKAENLVGNRAGGWPSARSLERALAPGRELAHRS